MICELCGFFAGREPQKIDSEQVNRYKGSLFIAPQRIMTVCPDCHDWYTRLDRPSEKLSRKRMPAKRFHLG